VADTSQERVRKTRRGSGGITLMDVARLAGVSAITVSRALNEPGLLTAETLARVHDAIERTGYVPNRVAGGLASSRTGLVAALVPTISGLVFLETVQAMTEALDAAGFQVMLGQSGYDSTREEALLDAIIGRRPDGVIITGVMHSPLARGRLAAAGIPIVETWDLTPTPIDMLVGFSHEKVGAAVAEYLAYRQVKAPALVSADDYRAGLRRRGFVEAAQKRGYSEIPLSLVPTPTTLGAGRKALAKVLADHPQTDAVFCSSDVLALGALTEAHARGLQVPRDLRVFGFGDLDFAAHAHPALSTVRIDGNAIGRQAARFIIQRVTGETVPQRIVDVGFKLIARASA
jgi:LacI family transcriptional regulator, gluconate utilization system Gnt-I transcriptional repressor